MVWTVGPGRDIFFNGQPFMGVRREGATGAAVVDGATQLVVDLFNRNGVTPDTIYEGHMGRSHTPRRTRESSRDRDRPISMTYGTVPPFEEFERDIRRPNPDESDGSPYWPEGTTYPMELVNSREIELADEFGGLNQFKPGRYAHKSGFRGDERQIYNFVKFLMDQEDAMSGEEGSPGDLASSIMTTLGYEWV